MKLVKKDFDLKPDLVFILGLITRREYNGSRSGAVDSHPDVNQPYRALWHYQSVSIIYNTKLFKTVDLFMHET